MRCREIASCRLAASPFQLKGVAPCAQPPYSDEIEDALRRMYCVSILPVLDKHSRPVLYMRLGSIDLAALERLGCTLKMVLRRQVGTSRPGRGRPTSALLPCYPATAETRPQRTATAAGS